MEDDVKRIGMEDDVEWIGMEDNVEWIGMEDNVERIGMEDNVEWIGKEDNVEWIGMEDVAEPSKVLNSCVSRIFFFRLLVWMKKNMTRIMNRQVEVFLTVLMSHGPSYSARYLEPVGRIWFEQTYV